MKNNPGGGFRRVRVKRLSRSEEREVITDIFGAGIAYNKFYDAVSGIYRIAEFVFLAAALFFGVIYIAVNADKIRYSQLEYLVQNFAYTLEENSEKRTYMTYEHDGDVLPAAFRGGLAVCGDSRVTIFSATGTQTAHLAHGFHAPVPVGSERYLLVYDQGGTGYKIFSSFSEMHSGNAENKIYGAGIGKDGSFALITGSNDGASVVLLYNKNFKLINKYTKYGHVMSVAISDDGGRIAILTSDVDASGVFSTEIMFAVAGSDSAERTVGLSGVLPLDCAFGDGSFVLLGDSAAFFYNGDGSCVGTIPLGAYDFAAVDGSGVIAVTRRRGGRDGFTVLLADSNGKIVFSDELDGNPIATSTANGSGFIMTDNAVVCIKEGNTRSREVSGVYTGDALCAVSASEVYVCTPSHAVSLRFD